MFPGEPGAPEASAVWSVAGVIPWSGAEGCVLLGSGGSEVAHVESAVPHRVILKGTLEFQQQRD